MTGRKNLRRQRRRWVGTSAGGVSLVRRGVHHGRFRALARQDVDGTPRELWRAAEPLHLPRALAAPLHAHVADVRRTRRLFERAGRHEGDFHGDVRRRLARTRAFVAGAASRDLGDVREIEKVYVDGAAGPRVTDVWAKLSWISLHPRDASLRIRFSFGSELAQDWAGDVRRARAADALAEAAFPECRVLARDARTLRLLRDATGGAVRLSERILFANAPGGGAAFHHDAETDQLGVAYAQLAGKTAWLALPKRELATYVAEAGGRRLGSRARTPALALRRLERESSALDELLNATPAFTRLLAERGRLYVLGAGDLLLLPSPTEDDAAWHSVFALGRRPSLALSFGIFRARGSR